MDGRASCRCCRRRSPRTDRNIPPARRAPPNRLPRRSELPPAGLRRPDQHTPLRNPDPASARLPPTPLGPHPVGDRVPLLVGARAVRTEAGALAKQVQLIGQRAAPLRAPRSVGHRPPGVVSPLDVCRVPGHDGVSSGAPLPAAIISNRRSSAPTARSNAARSGSTLSPALRPPRTRTAASRSPHPGSAGRVPEEASQPSSSSGRNRQRPPTRRAGRRPSLTIW